MGELVRAKHGGELRLCASAVRLSLPVGSEGLVEPARMPGLRCTAWLEQSTRGVGIGEQVPSRYGGLFKFCALVERIILPAG